MATATPANALEVPLYSVADASRYVRTRPLNLRRWAEGYAVAGRRYPPLLALPEERPDGGTALSLVREPPSPPSHEAGQRTLSDTVEQYLRWFDWHAGSGEAFSISGLSLTASPPTTSA